MRSDWDVKAEAVPAVGNVLILLPDDVPFDASNLQHPLTAVLALMTRDGVLYFRLLRHRR